MPPTLRLPLTLTLALIALALPARAQDADFSDPKIASATFGMLAPIVKDGLCAPHKVKTDLFAHAVNGLESNVDAYRATCQDCYDTGLSGVTDVLNQQGEAAYCQMMLTLFGPAGSTFPGLID